ncbi:MAG: hypothetical protein M1383_06010 [Patescibacteria group bacterium]|nr:hypothetical protein [Patescibacteria group bacterium]
MVGDRYARMGQWPLWERRGTKEMKQSWMAVPIIAGTAAALLLAILFVLAALWGLFRQCRR